MTQVMLSPWGQHSLCHSGVAALRAVPAHPGCCLTVAGSSMGSGISTKEATRYPRQARHRSRSKAVTRQGWMTPATKLQRHRRSVGTGKPRPWPHHCPSHHLQTLPHSSPAAPEPLSTPNPPPSPSHLILRSRCWCWEGSRMGSRSESARGRCGEPSGACGDAEQRDEPGGKRGTKQHPQVSGAPADPPAGW